MPGERYTFDTNLLFYSLDKAEPRKHGLARRLIGLADPSRVVILLQTIGELCNATTRKKPALRASAQQLIDTTSTLFTVIPAELEDIAEALLVQDQHGLQFWDAVLWATARRASCTILLTEDLQDARYLGGVTFRNPFQMSEAELDAFLA
jgi:predicted nucleic acid-binding protein